MSKSIFYFLHACPDSDAESVWDAQDNAEEITYDEFVEHIDIDEIINIFDWYAWDGEEGLQLKDDSYAASYHKSQYRGVPCYYICHSGIEYFFVLDKDRKQAEPLRGKMNKERAWT